MKTLRYTIAIALLVTSGQSLALFMPSGATISTDIIVATGKSSEGC